MDYGTALLTLVILCLGLALGRKSVPRPRTRVPLLLTGHIHAGCSEAQLAVFPVNTRDLVIDSIEVAPDISSKMFGRLCADVYLHSLSIDGRPIADFRKNPAPFPGGLSEGIVWRAGAPIELRGSASPLRGQVNSVIYVCCHYYEN